MKILELASWVARGSQKRAIMKVLERKMIPAQIYQEAVKTNPKVTRNSVSDVLREFKKMKLVRCINPSEIKGRFYELTDLGKKVKKLIES